MVIKYIPSLQSTILSLSRKKARKGREKGSIFVSLFHILIFILICCRWTGKSRMNPSSFSFTSWKGKEKWSDRGYNIFTLILFSKDIKKSLNSYILNWTYKKQVVLHELWFKYFDLRDFFTSFVLSYLCWGRKIIFPFFHFIFLLSHLIF